MAPSSAPADRPATKPARRKPVQPVLPALPQVPISKKKANAALDDQDTSLNGVAEGASDWTSRRASTQASLGTEEVLLSEEGIRTHQLQADATINGTSTATGFPKQQPSQ